MTDNCLSSMAPLTQQGFPDNRVVSLENVFASESFGSCIASLPYQADKVCLFWVGGAELCRTVDLQEQNWAPLCRA